MCCLNETHFRSNDIPRMKGKRWKKLFHENDKQKRVEEAILISHKIDFKSKTVTRDK